MAWQKLASVSVEGTASTLSFSSNSSSAVSNQPTDATQVGQLISDSSIQGKLAVSATFYVQRVGSPSGTMVYRIRKSSDNSIVATSAGTSASGLSTSKTAVTLNFGNELIPNENVRITVEGIYGAGSDDTANQSLSSWGGSSWTEYGNDCAGEINLQTNATSTGVSSGTFTTSKFIQTFSHVFATGGNVTSRFRINSNSNSVYATRRSTNGGSDSTDTSQTRWDFVGTADSHDRFHVTYICNISGEEKLGITHAVNR